MDEEKNVENVKVTDFYIEEKKVKEMTVIGESPIGDPVFNVSFEEGADMQLSQKKFECVRTTEKSDATTSLEVLVKKIGSELYAVLVEYGIKFAEVDPLLNEVVRLINDGQNKAQDILWGNEAYDRSLLDVNRVLLTKYAESETKEEVSQDAEGDDGATSTGSDADTKVED